MSCLATFLTTEDVAEVVKGNYSEEIKVKGHTEELPLQRDAVTNMKTANDNSRKFLVIMSIYGSWKSYSSYCFICYLPRIGVLRYKLVKACNDCYILFANLNCQSLIG